MLCVGVVRFRFPFFFFGVLVVVCCLMFAIVRKLWLVVRCSLCVVGEPLCGLCCLLFVARCLSLWILCVFVVFFPLFVVVACGRCGLFVVCRVSFCFFSFFLFVGI